MLAVTVLACVCGWVGMKLNHATRQREAVSKILAAGGSIGYDYQTVRVPGHLDYFSVSEHAPQSQPEWLRRIFGDDFFRDVLVVSFYNLPQPVREERFQQIAKLPTLEFMYLTNLKIALANGVGIRRIQDSDIEMLSHITRLHFIDLTGAELSQNGFRQLRESLPNATLGGPKRLRRSEPSRETCYQHRVVSGNARLRRDRSPCRRGGQGIYQLEKEYRNRATTG